MPAGAGSLREDGAYSFGKLLLLVSVLKIFCTWHNIIGIVISQRVTVYYSFRL